eukprot:COSAG04_NODE_56_length_30604_cov_692.571119_29_plen_86_part_00
MIAVQISGRFGWLVRTGGVALLLRPEQPPEQVPVQHRLLRLVQLCPQPARSPRSRLAPPGRVVPALAPAGILSCTTTAIVSEVGS